MEENRFYILIAKKLSGELTVAENNELELLYSGHPEYTCIYKTLQQELSPKPIATLQKSEKILTNLRTKLAALDPAFSTEEVLSSEEKDLIPEPYSKKFPRKKILIFSAFVVILSAAIVAINFSLKPVQVTNLKLSENNISTSAGSKTQVKLPDGTLVILNADSKLIYPDNFLGNTREVTLVGEAFFNVTENKQKPFIIHSKTMDIKVLGTVFNVKAYPGESTAEATLIKGSIEVTLTNRTNEKILLKPSEKITVSNITQATELKAPGKKILKAAEHIPLIAVDQVSVDKSENIIKEIGWTQNKLMFKNENLQSIITTIERWYGCSIEIKSERLKDLKFTGNFTQENVVQVIQALQLSYNFALKQDNNSFIIY
ncbi:MAG: FecR family protein [Ferruginibacter sp.]